MKLAGLTLAALTLRPVQGKFTVSLKCGYRFQDDDYDGAYGGVEFGYGF